MLTSLTENENTFQSHIFHFLSVNIQKLINYSADTLSVFTVTQLVVSMEG